MTDAFLVIAAVVTVIAAMVHVVFFTLESVLWSRPRTWRVFGVRSQADADVLRFMAYNQGFYNVFLALGAATGLVLLGSGVARQAGIAVAAFALVSMLLAAIVLVTANSRLWRGAVIQGVPPLVALVFLALTELVA